MGDPARSVEELIQLISESSQETLSGEDLAEILRHRKKSPELAQALRERIRLDASLSAALGSADVSIERILQTTSGGGGGWWLGLVLVLILGSGAFGIWWLRQPAATPETGEGVGALAVASKADSLAGGEDGSPAGLENLAGDRTSGDVGGSEESSRPSRSTEEKSSADSHVGNSSAETLAKPIPIPIPIPTPTPTPTRPPSPWTSFGMEEPPLEAFESTVYRDFGRTLISLPDLKRILRPVASQKGKLRVLRAPIVGFEGLVYFKGAWPSADAVLRFSVLEHNGYRLRFRSGGESVTFRVLDKNLAVGAYVENRKGDEDASRRLIWACDDDGRLRATGSGPLEVRHQNGRMLLSRGGVLLVSAALASRPEQMAWHADRQVKLHGLEFFRGELLPLAGPEVRGTVVDVDSEKLEWSEPSIGALERRPGRIRWRSDGKGDGKDDRGKRKNRGKMDELEIVSAPLAESSFRELILEVQQPSAGTGIAILDGAGKPIYSCSFVESDRLPSLMPGSQRSRSKASQRSTSLLLFGVGADGRSKHRSPDERKSIVVSVGDRIWLSWIRGPSTLRCRVSLDGRNWSETSASYSSSKALPPASRLALWMPRGKAATIGLGHVSTRELPALAKLASSLAKNADGRSSQGSYSAWLDGQIEFLPDGDDPTTFLRSSALATLFAGTRADLGSALLDRLIQEVQAGQFDVDRSLRILEDLALISDLDPKASSAKAFRLHLGEAYASLCRRRVLGGESRSFSAIWPHWMASGSSELESGERARWILAELMHSVFEGDRKSVREQLRSARFFLRDRRRLLSSWSSSSSSAGKSTGLAAQLDWVEVWLGRHGQRGEGEVVRPLVVAERHPTIEELSKEGYNTLEDIRAALRGEQYREVCQMISSVPLASSTGLLPSANDDELLASLPVILRAEILANENLRKEMAETFGPRGKIRVREAIAEEDVMRIESVALQFVGTEAALEAHSWLGDRELSAGRWLEALHHYREVEKGAGLVSLPVSPRIRLAGALLGRELGLSVSAPVDLDGASIAPAEFEVMVKRIRQARSGDAVANSRASVSLPPASYKISEWAAIDIQRGEISQGRVMNDSVGRIVRWSRRGDRLLLSSLSRLHLFDANDKKQINKLERRDRGRKRITRPAASRPTTRGDRFFSRLRRGDEDRIMAMSWKDGRIFWEGRQAIVSNPIIVGEALFAVIDGDDEGEIRQLYLARFHLESGNIVSRSPLVKVRAPWLEKSGFEVTSFDGHLVFVGAGSVMSCDPSGEMHWIRRLPWQSERASYRPRGQAWSEPPLISDGQLLTTQPGVAAVSCIDFETGAALWHRVVPGYVRTLGRQDGLWLLQLDDESILALGGKSADVVWHRRFAGLLTAWKDDDGRIVLAAETQGPKSRKVIELRWIDAATGRILAVGDLDSSGGPAPRISCFVAGPGGVSALFSTHGASKLSRQLVRLLPAGDARPPEILPAAWRK